MKPTKSRNNLIYRATFHTRSKQLGSPLSEELRKRYGKRSIRVIEGDTIKIVRGEFKGVDGKIAKVSTQKNSVSIEGVKKEKTKGDKFDIYIHTSNLVVTGLNTDDKWRIAKLEGKKSSEKPVVEKTPKKESASKETKGTNNQKKEVEK
ncbi:50S ribosomal protein L24 [Candidatus Nitrosarchaeum limnium]|jgi:large subunit ribosomal protein L24|uniref:Large ribosomal subunit protein uL24 n=1 Tax=Candidatus Nitrosarchaeum limnium BG20 TaxID=859192 RepID=S2EQQ2_9ARCH|nr:50S ribosomal protein L24 [Candidatus Nitrosarchaeum limnium]EPA04784.1 ribosomal protein L24 [Candidatus Nitrosarchaeum limnium BG20]